ncbi:glycoside hydrolase family 3 protein [Pseudomaricurvus hydrocarbonicus]|uniref:glycoside hydrolase family 3 protein n=1 Tax=Pseudomaricurvus hydrocarbonicus TaxID=1470433 RepID=UPI001AA012D6|nr:glycoside hydrolase family 3 N-terminal domain-containing protein [Aestuariicella hydrocarbonica]
MSKDGCQFRDLNRNGVLDPYEDWRLLPAERAQDLISRMTLPEKAGQLLHGNALDDTPFGVPATGYNLNQIADAIQNHHITYFVSRLALPPKALAEANNSVQAVAENTRLGIPVVMSTDPRHHFQETVGASVQSAGFTQFPETLGFAAINQSGLTREFADIVRQEYRAVGFTMALSPQADLSTEPRWPRINGTFGENAKLAKRMVEAYVDGIQDGSHGLGPNSVASVVKHWVGYGAAKDGLDAHNYYGRFADLSSEQLPYHIEPFKGAFSSKVAGVMPAYPIFSGVEINGKVLPDVAAGYNQPMLSMLRNDYGFEGVILSDWAITNDCGTICKEGFPEGERPSFRGISTAWGVENLTQSERFAQALHAGVDQFGGVLDSNALLSAVQQGRVSESRLDESVLRVLRQTFSLGIFEAPFVKSLKATKIVATPESKELALKLQAQSMVVLENKKQILPLDANTVSKVYLGEGIDTSVFENAGFTLVHQPHIADVAILKTDSPYETLYPNFFFGAIQHDGSLAFPDDQPTLQQARAISQTTPVILSIYLDRPAVLTPFKPIAAAVLGNFGASDQALVNALTGKVKAIGSLPFEMPASMKAVEKQKSDTPNDSESPLYPIGYRVSY